MEQNAVKGLADGRIIYDKHSIKGQQYKKIPDIFDEVAKGWEIYHGRQLFTYGLEDMVIRLGFIKHKTMSTFLAY